MKNYLIPVSYEMYGYVEIEAETLDAAILEAETNEEIGLPENAEYVEGSWQVDHDIAPGINEILFGEK